MKWKLEIATWSVCLSHQSETAATDSVQSRPPEEVSPANGRLLRASMPHRIAESYICTKVRRRGTPGLGWFGYYRKYVWILCGCRFQNLSGGKRSVETFRGCGKLYTAYVKVTLRADIFLTKVDH